MMNIDFIFPEIFLSLSIMFLLMLGVFKKNSERIVYNLSTIILLILLALVFNLFSISETFIFNNSYKIDLLSSFMKTLTIIILGLKYRLYVYLLIQTPFLKLYLTILVRK